MRKLGIDLGEVRVGIAISDPTGTIAQPHGILPRRDLDGAAERLAKLVKEYQVDEIVVGLPRTMRGEEGAMATQARALAEHLAEVLGVAVQTFDERLTSVAARRAMAGCGKIGHQDRAGIDQVAAAIILQNFLDHERTRVRSHD